jgi:excisionase family DNA binding protein
MAGDHDGVPIMPATKKKPAKSKPEANGPLAVPASPAIAGDVLTLAEAAAYLRLPETDVVSLVQSQGLPGRFAGTQWRFLKSAIQAWLSVPPPEGSKEGIWSVIGSWKDDPYLDEMLKEIYRQRGRPMTEEG